jgi:hypothetical protein
MTHNHPQSIKQQIAAMPLATWTAGGFFLGYICFFVVPVFFSANVMQFFQQAPALDPIGVDLHQMLSYSSTWWEQHQSPYIGFNLYPPLASVLFTPLLALDFPLAYRIVTLVSLACFITSTLLLAGIAGKKKTASPMLVLFLVSGLFSYGFQFEIERGQFNILAMFLCWLAIWLFHHKPGRRMWAYALFTLSVQLKVFPFIFILLLVDDWHDWKGNLRRFAWLALVNFCLLFILGGRVFIDFLRALASQTLYPAIWQGNHSIRCFVTQQVNFAVEHGWAGAANYAPAAQLFFLACLGLCLLVILWHAWRQNRAGINPHLLLACTLGALLIPSVSHDYKLSILIPPAACLFVHESRQEGAQHPAVGLLYGVFAFVYSSTLFSYTFKPPFLQNNFPALLVLLILTTVLSGFSGHGIEPDN